MQSTRYFCPILKTLEFSRQIFEKVSNIKFHQILPVGAQLFHTDRQMDKRTDITTLRVAFRNFANTPTNDFTVNIPI